MSIHLKYPLHVKYSPFQWCDPFRGPQLNPQMPTMGGILAAHLMLNHIGLKVS
jgi:hypothetical protein